MSSAAPLTGGAQLAPLSRQEIELLTRLLSDPSFFPREFKRWITDHSSDTVDIAKSQVHGLVDKGGDVYIPPPELVSQIKFVPFVGIISMPVGSGGSVHDVAAECDGNTVVWEFYAPFCEYHGVDFYLYMDGVPSNIIGSYQCTGPVDGPWTGKARSAIYLTSQFKPSKGTHTFGLNAITRGSGGAFFYIGGGADIYAKAYAPGFTRISRA